MEQITFGIVGSGWRSEFFLRIAAASPERFRVTGLVTRSAETARDVTASWGVPGYPDVEGLIEAERPAFVVVSVPRLVAPPIVVGLVEAGIPVLCETPPADDLPSLIELYEQVGRTGLVQVAEQYHLSPLVNAQLAVARSGRLGDVSQALVAQCHDYHGISVMRRALGIKAEAATVSASVFRSPLIEGPGRRGDPDAERVVMETTTSARFDFGDRLGLYDFASERYFSWIRGNRLVIRGDRGEIDGDEVRFLRDFRTPISDRLRRVAAGAGGNLEGLFLRGIQFADEFVFTNPLMPARLTDDEIAVALLLVGMHTKAGGGPDVYSLAEASQDHYLSLLMRRAAETGEEVRSRPQPWSDDV